MTTKKIVRSARAVPKKKTKSIKQTEAERVVLMQRWYARAKTKAEERAIDAVLRAVVERESKRVAASVRLDADDRAIIAKIMKKSGCPTQAGVIRMALRELYDAYSTARSGKRFQPWWHEWPERHARAVERSITKSLGAARNEKVS